jgi:MFS family permease
VSGGPGRYTALLRRSGVAWLLATGILARLPLSMYALALLLAVQRQTGSLADAGLVSGSAAAGYGVFGPVLGRMTDRYGQARVLRAGALADAMAFAALTAGLHAAAPTGTLVVLAFLAGASLPPVAACQRACWPLVTGGGALLDTAFAVDTMLLDAFLIIGPLLVAAITALASPTAALVIAAAAITFGAWAFAATPASRAWQGTGRTGTRAGPLRSAGIRAVVITIALTGIALGALRVTLVAFAQGQHALDAAGVLYTALGIGSLLGGLIAGALSWRPPPRRRYVLFLALFALLTTPLLAADTMPVMAALTALAGLMLAPVTICEFGLVGDTAPPGTTTEAYAWAVTATFAGSAAGNAIAGTLVQQTSWRTGVLLAAACLTLAAIVAARAQRALRPITPAA